VETPAYYAQVFFIEKDQISMPFRIVNIKVMPLLSQMQKQSSPHPLLHKL
jgi:hypothetical protein